MFQGISYEDSTEKNYYEILHILTVWFLPVGLDVSVEN